MLRKSSISQADSLKGKIWISSVALAFFVCAFGSLAYVVVSFLISDPFYVVFIPFLFLAMIVVAFGLWLSGEIAAPVEKVSLFAKSLERGVSATLPKTSGSKETDEIMETIHRLGGQVQRLVGSLENVSQGNLDAIYAQNSNTDRISLAFQKLLAKVSESIHAKQELEKLQNEVFQLSERSAFIRNDNFSTKIDCETHSTKEIALTINYLTERLTQLASRVRETAAKSQNPALEMKKNLQTIVLRDESRIQEVSRAAAALKKFPQLIAKISEEISQSTVSTSQEIEKIRESAKISQATFKQVGQLRKQLQESVQRIQKLREFSQEIELAAKTVGDLAQRANLVALNSSIQSAELGEHGRGFIVVSEEIQRLAARTDKTHKQINTLNKSIKSEIEKVEESLGAIVGEAANFSKFTIEIGNTTGDVERFLARYLKLQEKFEAYAGCQTGEITQAFRLLDEFVGESREFSRELRNSAQTAQTVLQFIEDTRLTVADYNFPAANAPARLSENDAEPAARAEIPVENLEGETYL